MLINQKNLQNLALQAINDCPANVSKPFEDGFHDFIEIYFEELEGYTWILFLEDQGGAEIDLELPHDSTLDILENYYLVNHPDYWRGVDLAIKMSHDLLVFTFETDSKTQAA